MTEQERNKVVERARLALANANGDDVFAMPYGKK